MKTRRRIRATVIIVILTVLMVTGPGVAPAGAQTDENAVHISTVPLVPGVRVELDGRRSTTDSFGVATFPGAERRDAGLRVKVLDESLVDADGVRSTLERIYGTGPDIVLTFSTEREVDFDFATEAGTPVELDRIQRMTMRSSVGDVVDVPIGRPIWLRSSRVVSTQNGPQERVILWSIEQVLVDGSNVVNRAELRFEPVSTQHVTVPLLFFTARIRVTDAFFGFSHGGSLEMTKPDGTITTHDIPSNGEVVLNDMPRGDYEFAIDGAGVRLVRPMVLSRDQDVQLELLSWLDLGAVLVVVLLFCAIPLVFGIRRRRSGRTELAVGASRRATGPPDPVEHDPVEIGPNLVDSSTHRVTS